MERIYFYACRALYPEISKRKVILPEKIKPAVINTVKKYGV